MDALNLRNARILVTGGAGPLGSPSARPLLNASPGRGAAGLIGSHIVDRLITESPAEIVVLDNFVRGRRENLAGAMPSGRVTIVEGDIRDRQLVTEAMQGIDVVFHQAAIRITQCAEEPALAMDLLVNGTFIVLDAARQAGVRKIVAASSASVYGLAD